MKDLVNIITNSDFVRTVRKLFTKWNPYKEYVFYFMDDVGVTTVNLRDDFSFNLTKGKILIVDSTKNAAGNYTLEFNKDIFKNRRAITDSEVVVCTASILPVSGSAIGVFVIEAQAASDNELLLNFSDSSGLPVELAYGVVIKIVLYPKIIN